jgi:lipopolysaccharide export system protein LptC
MLSKKSQFPRSADRRRARGGRLLEHQPGSFLDKPVAQVDESHRLLRDNAHSVQFLPDGKLQYEMTADKVEHLKASEVTLVTTPT